MTLFGMIAAIAAAVALSLFLGPYGILVLISAIFGFALSTYLRNKDMQTDLQKIKEKLAIEDKDDFNVPNEQIEKELEAYGGGEFSLESPVLRKIGAIFIPVSDIEKARDWYCGLLGIEADANIVSGHLYCIPVDNDRLNIVLDSSLYSPGNVFKTPMFHFNTDDIQAAFAYALENGIELVTEIENGHRFNFKDPDGNMLMICKC